MQKLFFLLLITTCTQVFAQDSLNSFNYSRNNITKTGMKVLGSWGVANLGVGAIGWASANNKTDKYFYRMSTFWGAVNTGVAVLGFTGAKRNMKQQLNSTDNLKAQQTIERTFLINGGLDLAYIGTGIYLNGRGNKREDEKLKGYGSSMIMQGIFLLLFDGTMYTIQRTNGNKLRNFLEKNPITFTGNSIGIVYNIR